MPKSTEKLYQDYLLKSKLDESEMDDTQKSETKRAFYGGLSEMFVHFSVTISQMNEDSALIEYESLREQIQNFWNQEVENGN